MTQNATNYTGTSQPEWSISVSPSKESVIVSDEVNSISEFLLRERSQPDIFWGFKARAFIATEFLKALSPGTPFGLMFSVAGGALADIPLIFPNALPNNSATILVNEFGQVTWGAGTYTQGNAISFDGTDIDWDLSALPLLTEDPENTDIIPFVDGGVYKRMSWGDLKARLGEDYNQVGTFDPTTSTIIETAAAFSPQDGTGNLNDSYLIAPSGTDPHAWDFGAGRIVNLETGGEIFYNGTIWVYRAPSIAPQNSSQITHTRADLTTVTTVEEELRSLESGKTIVKQGTILAGDLTGGSYVLTTLPTGYLLVRARVRTVAAWNNAAEGSIGIASNNEVIMPRSIIKLQDAGVISSDSGDNVTVTTAPTEYRFYATNAPTVGSVEVFIEAIKVDALG